MSSLILDDRHLPVDKDGYLIELADWSEAAAAALAEREGIELTDAHWEILWLIRDFYAEFQLSPANRPLIKFVASKLGSEKGNSLHLNQLFNGAPAKLSAKLAGLPKPTNCL
jgi:tRNA 2-thiouridine synthesizing protein E